MANFFADWRNPVLILAVAGTLTFGALWFSGHQPFSPAAFTVGTHTFTERDVVKELKAKAGYQVIGSMIDTALLEEYAAEKGIAVTDADVDQLMRYLERRLELSGESLEDMLESRGMSRAALRQNLYTEALQVKVLLKPEELKEAVAAVIKSGQPPFTLPPLYKFRLLTYTDEAIAHQAAGILSKDKPEALYEAAAKSYDPAASKQIRVYASGLSKDEDFDKFIAPILKGLKPGQSSKPLAIPGNKTMRFVVQLVEVAPAEKPTYENSAIAIGQAVIQSQMQMYYGKLREIQGKVLSTAEPQFFSTDYDAIKKHFEDIKRKNPQIPGANIFTEPPGAPGATPGTPTPSGR